MILFQNVCISVLLILCAFVRGADFFVEHWQGNNLQLFVFEL